MSASRTNSSGSTSSTSSSVSSLPSRQSSPQWDAFLSYSYDTGSGIVLAFREIVLNYCARNNLPYPFFWYDQDEEASMTGMSNGVTNSTFFVLFATENVLERPAVQHEVKTALDSNKTIIIIDPNGRSTTMDNSHYAEDYLDSVLGVPINRGRQFSTNPVKLANGHVHLHANDYDHLLHRIKYNGKIIPFYSHFTDLLNVSAGKFIESIHWTTDDIYRSSSNQPDLSVPLYRMRRPLQSNQHSDVLIIGAPNSLLQRMYLMAALGEQTCNRRALIVNTLEYHANKERATIAVQNTHTIIFVLTAKCWECQGLINGLGAVINENSKDQGQKRVAFLYEPVIHFGGSRFEEIFEDTPQHLKSIYALHIVQSFERQKSKRNAMLEWLLNRIGAVKSNAVGGICPPPLVPPGFLLEPIKPTLDKLEECILRTEDTGSKDDVPLAIALGGIGGAGKSTLASCLAASSAILRSYDDVLWITLGSIDKETLLTRMLTVIEELENQGGLENDHEPRIPIKSIETASTRLRYLLELHHVLLIVDDAWYTDHFVGFLGALPRASRSSSDTLSTNTSSDDLPPRTDTNSSYVPKTSKILFTSRNLDVFSNVVEKLHLPVHLSTVIEMNPLPYETAKTFLFQVAGITDHQRKRLDISSLLSVSGSLPLTLTILGAALKKQLQSLNLENIDAERGIVKTVEDRLRIGTTTAVKTTASTTTDNLPDNASSESAALYGQWLTSSAFLAAIAARSATGWEKYLPVFAAIQYSLVTHFSPADILNFAALSLFAEDSFTDEAIIAVAWRNNANETATRELLLRLQVAGLAKVEVHSNSAYVMLHDLAYDFASALAAIEPKGGIVWHRSFLNRLYAVVKRKPVVDPLPGSAAANETECTDGLSNVVTLSFVPSCNHTTPASNENRAWWVATNPLYPYSPVAKIAKYTVKYVLYHLYRAELYYEGRYLFRSLPWLIEYVNLYGLPVLLADIQSHVLTPLQGMNKVHGTVPVGIAKEYELLFDALRLVSPTLDKTVGKGNNIPAQLLGRLLHRQESCPAILAPLLKDCQDWCMQNHWLCPLNSVSLEAPGGPLLSVLEGHSASIECMDVLPNGKIVSGSGDNTLRVWNPENTTCEFILEGHELYVTCVTGLSNNRIVSGSFDCTLKVWDANTGVNERTLTGHEGYVSCVVELSDKLIASGSMDATVRIWDPLTGTCLKVLEGHIAFVTGVVELRTTKQLVSGSMDSTLRLWNRTNGVCDKVLEGHSAYITCMQELSDGRLVSGSYDNTIRLWNLWDETAHATTVLLEGHSKGIACLQELSDHRLASGSWDTTIRIWNTQTNHCLHVLEGHTGSITSIQRLPGNDHIVSSSRDCTLRIWRITATNGPKCQRILEGHTASIEWMKLLTPDKAVSASGDNTLRIWDVTTTLSDPVMVTEKFRMTCMKIVSGTSMVVGGYDGTLRLWNTLTGTYERIIRTLYGRITCLALLKDGRLVSGYADAGAKKDTINPATAYGILLWDKTISKEEMVLHGHNQTVVALNVLWDDRLVSVSSDLSVRIWSTRTGLCEFVSDGHKESIQCLTVLPDNRLITGAWDHNLRLWDTAMTNSERLYEGHRKGITCVQLLPDHRRMVSAAGDTNLRIWDIDKGICENRLEGHTEIVTYITVLPDNRIVSASEDKTVCLWDTVNPNALISQYRCTDNFISGIEVREDILYIGNSNGVITMVRIPSKG